MAEGRWHRAAPQACAALFATDCPKALSAADIAAVQKAVLALPDSPEGQVVLKSIGMPGGFDTATEDKLRGLLKFLGD